MSELANWIEKLGLEYIAAAGPFKPRAATDQPLSEMSVFELEHLFKTTMIVALPSITQALRALSEVDEQALDVAYRAGVAHVWDGPAEDRARDVTRTIVTAYLAALTLPRRLERMRLEEAGC